MKEIYQQTVEEVLDYVESKQRDELLKAMKNSSRSYEEILAFITAGETSEDEQNRTE